ncbi:MAG: radical SAM protein [Anaerolineales bacterium]
MTVHYRETECASAIQRVHGMPFDWSLNPYQGCVHGCHYCYARRFHGFLDLDPGRDFEREIFVKTNVATQLRRELSRPGWKGDQVSIGTATDPYQPIEGRYQLTRACLQAFLDHRNPVGLVTKGTLIVRDLDILQSLEAAAGTSICFSLTTLDTDLWRQLEPGTPPPNQRLRAMEVLARAGVRAGIFIAPVLPGITDDIKALEGLVQAAVDHGAQFVGSQLLYLRDGTRQHFLAYLQQNHPDLMARYRSLYPGPYAPKRFQQRLSTEVAWVKRRVGLVDAPPPPRRAIRQLSFC